MIEVKETLDSRLNGKTGELFYAVLGAADKVEALAAMLDFAPEAYSNFPRVDEEADITEVVVGVYTGNVVFRSEESQKEQDPKRKAGSYSVSMDISGQSVRLTQAYKHIGEYAASGKTAKKFKGAINVTSDGVQGTDVLIPSVTITINYTFEADLVDDDYMRTVATLVGTQNKGEFKGYAAGELLLTRVTATERSDGANDISFGFAYSQNATAVIITGQDGNITVPTKRGWDYLWTYYDDRTITDGSLKYVAKVPVSAHLEQVYKDGDFDLLGIA